jgi:hypothetical protein
MSSEENNHFICNKINFAEFWKPISDRQANSVNYSKEKMKLRTYHKFTDIIFKLYVCAVPLSSDVHTSLNTSMMEIMEGNT